MVSPMRILCELEQKLSFAQPVKKKILPQRPIILWVSKLFEIAFWPVNLGLSGCGGTFHPPQNTPKPAATLTVKSRSAPFSD